MFVTSTSVPYLEFLDPNGAFKFPLPRCVRNCVNVVCVCVCVCVCECVSMHDGACECVDCKALECLISERLTELGIATSRYDKGCRNDRSLLVRYLYVIISLEWWLLLSCLFDAPTIQMNSNYSNLCKCFYRLLNYLCVSINTAWVNEHVWMVW